MTGAAGSRRRHRRRRRGRRAAATPAVSAATPAGRPRRLPCRRTTARARRPTASAPARPERPAAGISCERPAGGWAVETHGLTKRFGANVAVDDVELLVPRGSAFGYLGPNGAGKTTLIRTLLGLTRADGGTMSLLGIPVPAERSRALARVGAIVDEPRFHPHLTGRENLRLLAAARGGDARQRIGPSLDRVGLTERADDKVASYSMGMRQRLGVASCLLGDPELLILDEPMNGLDPAGMHQMRAMIMSLADEGRTVVLSSHLLDEVERTCDAVAIVDRGRVVRQGPIDELTRGAGRGRSGGLRRPGRAARLIDEAGIAAGTSDRRRADGDPARGGLARAGRRDQPAAGRRGDLRVRPPGDPRVAGGLVPVRDDPTGRAPVTSPAPAAEPLLSEGRSPARPVRTPVPRRLGASLPTWELIATRHLELRKRRGLMITVAVMTIAPTVLILGLRLAFHLFDPAHYGPAGPPTCSTPSPT